MKLEKAIEILEGVPKHYLTGQEADEAQAIELGIEAIKEVKFARAKNFDQPIQLLSGETKE